MSDKSIYQYRILKAYSLLVDFDGEPARENVPSPVEGETFKQWKKRVLGDSISNVTVFTPVLHKPQTKMTTLQNTASAGILEKVFRAFGKDKAAKKDIAVDMAVSRTEHQLSTFPKDALKDILAETTHEVEPSVAEFFERLETDTSDDINIHDLLVRLVDTYNESVRLSRRNVRSVPRVEADPHTVGSP